MGLLLLSLGFSTATSWVPVSALRAGFDTSAVLTWSAATLLLRTPAGDRSPAGVTSNRLLDSFLLRAGLTSHADAWRVAVGEFDPCAFESGLNGRQV
jgi:hypothetical protein